MGIKFTAAFTPTSYEHAWKFTRHCSHTWKIWCYLLLNHTQPATLSILIARGSFGSHKEKPCPSLVPQDALTRNGTKGTCGLPNIKHFSTSELWPPSSLIEMLEICFKKKQHMKAKILKILNPVPYANFVLAPCNCRMMDYRLPKLYFISSRVSYAWLQWLPLLRYSIISDLAPQWKVMCFIVLLLLCNHENVSFWKLLQWAGLGLPLLTAIFKCNTT